MLSAIRPYMFLIGCLLLFLSANVAHAVVDCSDEGTTGVPQIECEALIDLYNSTDGVNWYNNEYWTSSSDVSTWFGVYVEGGHVTSLYLSNNGLNGSLPKELENLSFLEVLVLNDNTLSGTIPSELGSLSHLTYLGLQSNQLSGSIPTELGDLTQLTVLALRSNQLGGSIPAELSSLAHLTYLGLQSNQLSGSIPVGLVNLTQLTELALYSNQLGGSIPVGLGNLRQLTYLGLFSNQLSGSIPVELGNLTQLTVLALHSNQLSGSIPVELGNLTQLTVLDLSSNQLSGSIPPELGNLSQLTGLWLNTNELSGTIPIELANLLQLELLSLSYNNLTGSIPAELGDLASLKELDLSLNLLTGTIPPEIGNLINLEVLDLSWNGLFGPGLTGSIPPEIGNLINLRILSLDFNQLSGTIPVEIGDLANLIDLGLWGNLLTGTIPAEIGNLVNLTELGLGSNQLQGDIPESLINLVNLDSLFIGYNYLNTTITNLDLETFLTEKDPDWAATQALPGTLLPVTESGDPDANFTFSAELLDPLAAGHAVFLNFDNLEGNWLTNTEDGGHIELPDQNGNTFSKDTSLEKLGIRFFRAAIFNTMGDSDPANDIMIGGWSNTQTCTLPACLDMVPRPNSHGNPAITGSGSELFKNVDVAKGSYHLSKVDMSVSGKGPSFAFSRAYNSLHKSPWTFAYEMKAQFRGDFQQEMAIGPREDGHMQYFFKDMADPGQWHALNPGDFDKLVENEGDASFSLYTQGNRIYNFSDPAGAKAGRLETIKDRLNNALTFTYDGSNNLTGVADANNRIYTIGRDPSNRISRVTDFSGRYVEYGYSDDGHNMITNVRKMRGDNFYDRYTYHSTLPTFLQTISDARVYPATQLDITYTPDPITNDLYRVHTLTNTDGETEFTYGSSAQWGVYTGVSQPQVDTINHNRVYIRDAGRVIKMYDAKSASDALASGDIVTTKTYKTAADNTHFTDLGLVTQTSDPKSNNTIIAYNDTIGGGKPSQITDALVQETQANYNSTEVGVNLRPVISVVQKAAGVGQTDLTTQYQDFTLTGQARGITDAEGYPTNRTFDAGNGLITQSTDSRNNVMQYGYDVYGNIIQTTQLASPENIVTTRTYYNENDPTQLGRLKTEVSPLRLITTYTYDEHGNILSRNESKASDDINYTTYYEFDASDNLIKTTDPKNNATEYTYDNLNRKKQESYKVTIDGTLEILTKNYSYDALGRLATITNERGQSSQTHYTSRNQVERKVNPLNETTVTYTYDKNGNVETVTDGEDRVVTTSYDELNRKTRVTDNLGNYQEWVYNTAGQVASYQDGRGNITCYAYDKVGNLTKLTDSDGGITESTYDGNGNVLTVKDPNLHTTTYVYDELDRRISTTLNNNGQQWIYTYDANGNVLSEITPTDEKTEKTYDALNRVTQLTEKASDTTIVRQISYTYDDNSNVLSESSGSNMISYAYDEINRVISITDQYGQTIGYEYDEAGNRATLTYPGDKSIDYFYDVADRLESLTDWLSNTTSYTRNAAGQLLQVTYGNGTKVKYTYDSAGRLNLLQNLKADDSVISSHSMTLLDGAGNIKEVNVTLPLEPVLPESISLLTYDDKNRILKAGTKYYHHDETGRIIEEDKDGTQTIYNFDIKDHITSITQGGSTLSSNIYDLNNNRISHTQNGIETRYVIEQLASLPNVVAETDNQGTVLQYYVYGEGLVSQIDGNGDSHYYHYDPTGHTLALSDDSGNVTDKYAYVPYGKTTSEGTTHNPFKFVGRHGVMDDGGGLHYMRARYYKEDIKRFMSLDALHGEILSPQSLNRYAYALGNPVMGVDPSGKTSMYTYNLAWLDNNCDYSCSKVCQEISEAMETYQSVKGVGSEIGLAGGISSQLITLDTQVVNAKGSIKTGISYDYKNATTTWKNTPKSGYPKIKPKITVTKKLDFDVRKSKVSPSKGATLLGKSTGGALLAVDIYFTADNIATACVYEDDCFYVVGYEAVTHAGAIGGGLLCAAPGVTAFMVPVCSFAGGQIAGGIYNAPRLYGKTKEKAKTSLLTMYWTMFAPLISN